MISVSHFTELVLIPTLKKLHLDSDSARLLLMGTAAIESDFTHLKQIGGGPAIGLYQMEPRTHRDVWENVLFSHPEKAIKVAQFSFDHDVSDGKNNNNIDQDMKGLFQSMAGNLYYATAMCRMQYWRFPEKLPACADARGMAEYYKKYWNSKLGATSLDDAESAFKQMRGLL